MHTWHWQTWQDLPYLTCSLLAPWSHGFFTQQFWSRSPAELVEVLQPQATVHRVKQVHGNTVLTPSEVQSFIVSETAQPIVEDSSSLPSADGLLTEQEAQSVWICTADCTPVLVADAETGQVAAIHAGWRGTAAEIVPKAIARLQGQGSRLANLRVALGPAIAGEVYQVSTTVAAEVGATVLPDAAGNSSEEILEQLKQLPNAPVLDDAQPGRARLDVRRVIELQLERLGITANQVAIAPFCTYQHSDRFFSYRRTKRKSVQWSGIVSGKPT